MATKRSFIAAVVALLSSTAAVVSSREDDIGNNRVAPYHVTPDLTPSAPTWPDWWRHDDAAVPAAVPDWWRHDNDAVPAAVPARPDIPDIDPSTLNPSVRLGSKHRLRATAASGQLRSQGATPTFHPTSYYDPTDEPTYGPPCDGCNDFEPYSQPPGESAAVVEASAETNDESAVVVSYY